ncbi:hypothetical protein EC957_011309 [Mortierella hygrophila]|uniref:Uncharacterized protein n=1 Tax=Mortierella hygrophila TaxID=979708 RepID=A0A9P6F8Y3_9FUNG|nr:hypothetical protein EC957_011309 [Mortierella hygrophila]
MHLFAIFKRCPNLEEIIIKPTWTARYVHDNLSSQLDLRNEDALVNGIQAPMIRLGTCIPYKAMITLSALTLHYSAHERALSDLEITSILEHFPDFEEHSFADRDAGPTLMAGLRTNTNRGMAQRNPSGQRNRDKAGGTNGQYIWACRGLRTLHMTVECRLADTNSSENALVMFGFMSRQCPQLQVLHLRRIMLDMSFKGGLCLLTRLQGLERIKITTGSDYELDGEALFWLRIAPSTIDHINYPLLEIKTWRDVQN